jgi:hypothetical protein
MSSAISTTRLGCEFDRFLYASVGDDNNGMPLTVLSALARMDVDPWDEALTLAHLPHESAVKRLASVLGPLRNASVTGVDLACIAGQLLSLLPCPRERAPAILKAFAQVAPTKHPEAVSAVLTAVTYVIFMLAVQWLVGNLHAPRQIQSPSNSAPAIDSPRLPTSIEEPQAPIR